MEEVETVFGNRMTAGYHQTDTCLYSNRFWQIAAGPVMRYYEDSAAITLAPTLLRDYFGTYEIALGNRMTVTTHEGKLVAVRGTGKPTEMLGEAPVLSSWC